MLFFLGEMKFSKVLELQFLDVLILCLLQILPRADVLIILVLDLCLHLQLGIELLLSWL